MSIRPKTNKKGEQVPGWWVIDYYPDGKKRDPKTKKPLGKRVIFPFEGTKDQAQGIEIDLRRKHPAIAPISPYIRETLPEFLIYYRNNRQPSTVKSFLLTWDAHLSAYFGSLKFSYLTPAHIEQYKAKRLTQGVKKRTVEKELSMVKAVISWAVENNWAVPLPFKIKTFEKKHTKAPLPSVPSFEEVQAILDNIHPAKRGLALLMYSCGLRKSEAFNLKRCDVDINGGLIRVTGKGGKERQVPIITEDLGEELQSALDRDNGTQYLYINPATKQPYKDIREALYAAAKRAGISKRIYPHLLRHAYCTHSAISGVDPRTTQRNAGHVDISTTMIYTHIAAEHQKLETQKLGAKINTIPQGKRWVPQPGIKKENSKTPGETK